MNYMDREKGSEEIRPVRKFPTLRRAVRVLQKELRPEKSPSGGHPDDQQETG